MPKAGDNIGANWMGVLPYTPTKGVKPFAPGRGSSSISIPALLIAFLLLATGLYAEPSLQVIYPSEGQQIGMVDSTFVFGNVTKGARLWINDIEIPVHPNGGWLAFLDISQGPFRFHLKAAHDGDTTWLERSIQVGPKIPESPQGESSPRAVSPGTRAIYQVGDTIAFSFEAPAGGTGWFYLDKRPAIEMYQSPLASAATSGEVFGTVGHGDLDSGIARYVGYYKFADADTGIHRLCYQFHAIRLSPVENPVVYENCIDSVITVISQSPPIIGTLTGRNHIIRTGPQMGYKLLYMPPGINVRVTGIRDDFYQLHLADNVTGYINVDSVTILPDGTPPPVGRVSIITIDRDEAGVRISADIGARLPYEILESANPPQLDIDLFGVTSNVDWIRYNVHSPLAETVRWSQPQDEIFRLTIEADYIWGYKAYYDGTMFTLILREKPHEKGLFSNALQGVKIAIDPGHSADYGATGPTGLKEKDANLWIAHELRQMLLKRGADVMMTRMGHEHVALYNRPEMAEKWGADLLISVHNNALPDGINPFVNNGTSVYYYHPHSQKIAEAIHKRMLKRTGLPDHGLYYGNLVLTRYSSVPSVLVECAFMMIPEQEAMLRTDDFQRKCARGIMEGIEDFLKGKR
jgi:N-acetylmuramoyl-L-alanine amidase